jgi:cellulose synthase/poly-beta-1,6-N-acetylglucosamine synthase-like glycosyltransferase
MSEHSTSHLVLIPSYNPGPKVLATVRAARAQWAPVWVVVDGSTDGSAEQLQALAAGDSGMKVIVLPENRGKGFRWPASCRPDPDIYGRFASRSQKNGARQAGF